MLGAASIGCTLFCRDDAPTDRVVYRMCKGNGGGVVSGIHVPIAHWLDR